MLMRKATAFVSRILSVMGLVDAPSDRPGFGTASSSADGEGSSQNAAAREDAWCAAVAGVRDQLRAAAHLPPPELKGAVMDLSDRSAVARIWPMSAGFLVPCIHARISWHALAQADGRFGRTEDWSGSMGNLLLTLPS